MKTYEEAKKIAQEKVAKLGLSINSAGELPDAYIFDNEDIEVDGGLPIVIRKEDGEAFNYWNYMVQNDLYADDIKDIEF